MTPSKHNGAWYVMTEEKRAEAVRLFKQGWRIRHIATKLEITNDTCIRQVLVRQGIDPRRNWTKANKRPKIEALLARGWSVEKIAEKLGVWKTYVRRIKANGRTH